MESIGVSYKRKSLLLNIDCLTHPTSLISHSLRISHTLLFLFHTPYESDLIHPTHGMQTTDRRDECRWEGLCLMCCNTIATIRNKVQISTTQCVAVCCSVLQCVAVCCSVLQCVARVWSATKCKSAQPTAIHCDAPQLTVKHCNSL